MFFPPPQLHGPPLNTRVNLYENNLLTVLGADLSKSSHPLILLHVVCSSMLFATPRILIFLALLLVHCGVDGVQITG